MTRGSFVLIKDKKIYISIQFNGDMFPETKGKIVQYFLKTVETVEELQKAILEFDQMTFGYSDYEGKEFIQSLEIMNDLNFSNQYFRRFNSDYLYIKNADDTPYLIQSYESGKEIAIQPNEVQVWHFGELVQPEEAA